MSDGRRFWSLDMGAGGIVWAHRTATQYGDLEDVHTGFRDLLEQVDALPPGEYGLVIDVRAAPRPRNDQAFEAVVLEYRPRLVSRFRAAVLLVKTAAGKMQLTRMSRKNPTPVPVTDSPEEAEQLLLAALEESP